MTISKPIRISPELVRIYSFVESAKDWVSTRQIVEGVILPDTTDKLPDTTTRNNALKLFRSGIFERIELYPEYYYRVSPNADKSEYLLKIKDAQRLLLSRDIQN